MAVQNAHICVIPECLLLSWCVQWIYVSFNRLRADIDLISYHRQITISEQTYNQHISANETHYFYSLILYERAYCH